MTDVETLLRLAKSPVPIPEPRVLAGTSQRTIQLQAQIDRERDYQLLQEYARFCLIKEACRAYRILLRQPKEALPPASWSPQLWGMLQNRKTSPVPNHVLDYLSLASKTAGGWFVTDRAGQEPVFIPIEEWLPLLAVGVPV